MHRVSHDEPRPSTTRCRRALLVATASLTVAACAGVVAAASTPPPLNVNALERLERANGFGRENRIRIVRIDYVAHDGLGRAAYVLLPRWYGPHDDPAIPLVISPHGRGVPALANVRLWGNLPAIGDFAVVCPEGQGRRLRLYAWGYPGDIADLARMPAIVGHALPYLHVDPRRIYAFGSSMGGQETLLLVAHDPHLLAGAAAFDADTNLAARYAMIADIPDGTSLQRKLVAEVGGTPSSDPEAYRVRSPLDDARAIAFSGVPLQIWWSTKDKVVRDQAGESGLLVDRIKQLNPDAPVVQLIGTWTHSVEFGADRRLVVALADFGLVPVRRGEALDAHAKRALGVPPNWSGPPLAIAWRVTPHRPRR